MQKQGETVSKRKIPNGAAAEEAYGICYFGEKESRCVGQTAHQLLLCLVLLPRQDLHCLDSLLYVMQMLPTSWLHS